MNIFVLDRDPAQAAIQQCDKHVVKMIVESCQMLSTAHRILDGTETRRLSKSGKTMSKYWELPDSRENVLYKAVHFNHPCTIWTMESSSNYHWHFQHLMALFREYTYRYGKTHKSELLIDALSLEPVSITDRCMTPFRLAMGDQPHLMNTDDPVGSYQAFYQTKQDRFKMVWTKRNVPDWFEHM